MAEEAKRLRSARSYGPKTKDAFIHRSWMKSEGLPDNVFDGRPVDFLVGASGSLVERESH